MTTTRTRTCAQTLINAELVTCSCNFSKKSDLITSNGLNCLSALSALQSYDKLEILNIYFCFYFLPDGASASKNTEN